MANVSKSFSIPDEESSVDTLSVSCKFLNEVKDTLVTLQRVVKHRMNGNITNLSSLTHQEIHKIFKDEFVPIVNQVDAREADDCLDRIKVLEIENERLLRAVVNQDIMSIVQNNSVVDTSDLHTELDRTKEKLESCIIKKDKEYATLWNDLYKKFSLKGDETNALLKPVTSNLVPITREYSVMKNDKVIAPGMFRINPFKTYREAKPVPNKPLRASVRTKPIIVSQPSVIHKKTMNSNSNGSGIKNKEVDVEEHHRNLLLSKNKIHISSKCKNIKLDIQNDKSEVVYAMCKQCLITANHDVCVLNYVNDMNSHDDNKTANVSKVANQKTHKPKVKKSENESESQFDSSEGDNACASNPQEPTNKRFPNSSSFLGRLFKFIYGASTRVVPNICQESEAAHQLYNGSLREQLALEMIILL
ncbi:hypothetical protein Tco_1364791 [Tanacetum coccineum]